MCGQGICCILRRNGNTASNVANEYCVARCSNKQFSCHSRTFAFPNARHIDFNTPIICNELNNEITMLIIIIINDARTFSTVYSWILGNEIEPVYYNMWHTIQMCDPAFYYEICSHSRQSPTVHIIWVYNNFQVKWVKCDSWTHTIRYGDDYLRLKITTRINWMANERENMT